MSSFEVKERSIVLKSGMKGVKTLTMTASNDIEHKHWCYAVDIAVTRLRKESPPKVIYLVPIDHFFNSKLIHLLILQNLMKTVIPPPHFPVHSGILLYLNDSMKWKKTYVVMTEDSLFMHEHRRTGFGTPCRHTLTPNAMIFATTLKEHSFEVRFH